MSIDTNPPVESSAWLRGRVTERANRARALGLRPESADILVVMPLGVSGPPGSRADRSCDRCDAFVQPGTDLILARLRVLPGLLLAGGLCLDCATREGWLK